jgi:hypothetical protein
MSKQKMSEDKTRGRLIRFAKLIGAEEDLQQLFKKWDNILALVPEGQEKQAMSRQAILEVQSLLDIHAERHDGLTINDEVIIPGKV